MSHNDNICDPQRHIEMTVGYDRCTNNLLGLPFQPVTGESKCHATSPHLSVDIAPQQLEPRIAPPRSVAHQMMPQAPPRITLYRRVVLRVMHPRPPDDPLRGPSRRVRSPRRGARQSASKISKVDVMLGPERPRHIVTSIDQRTFLCLLNY